MFRVSIGEYEVSCQADGLPEMVDEYQKRAVLSEVFESADGLATWCFVSVGQNGQWPFLVVAQRYSPAHGGFFPGLLLVPETRRLFVGAGRRLLGYDLVAPARLWEDEADCGFWSWSRHGEAVLMAAELELACWDIHGCKKWSRFAEPPWGFEVGCDIVTLDVMGSVSRLVLHTGEPVHTA
jgi:hypothetical protein